MFLEESCTSCWKFSKCIVYGTERSVRCWKEGIFHSSSAELGFKFEPFDLILYFSVFFFDDEPQTDVPAFLAEAQWLSPKSGANPTPSVVAKSWNNRHCWQSCPGQLMSCGAPFNHILHVKPTDMCWQIEKFSSLSAKKFGVIFPGSWVEPLGSVSVAHPSNWIPALTAADQFMEKGQHLGLTLWTWFSCLLGGWHQKQLTSALKITLIPFHLS